MVKYFKTALIILSVSLFSRSAYANGVAVVDATTESYFQLDSSVVTTIVDNEVAITTVRNVFTNTLGHDTTVVFAYPNTFSYGSGTSLRWNTGSGWHSSQIISQAPSDTLPRSGATSFTLQFYLLFSPFVYSIPNTIASGGHLTVEYTYVELLQYTGGTVLYYFPNNYSLIQTSALAHQELNFDMTTVSTIDTLAYFGSQIPDQLTYDDNSATVSLSQDGTPANQNYIIAFKINLETTAAYDYSTYLNAGDVPDDYQGYFLLKILPFKDAMVEGIPKNFTLMIDRSGSMNEDFKIDAVKSAALYIINNLNANDHFNIVEFSDGSGSFRDGLVPFTPAARDAALAFINNLDARGGTNISGAFETVLPTYAEVDSANANIIMFLSDGEPTSGIVDTPTLLSSINQLVSALDDTICIYTLATSDAVDRQFVTALSVNHHGFTDFVDTLDVMGSISDYYNAIRYPVLIDPQLTFSPSGVLTEIYPELVPNFFEGNQVLVSGRYSTPQPIGMNLSGIAYGRPILDDYNFTLASTPKPENQFQMKIWAKQKMEALLQEYYLNPDDQALQQALETQIIWLSMNYGVISPFTSLSAPSPSTSIADETNGNHPTIAADFELMGNYPNPYNASTTIQFKINQNLSDALTVNIYNTMGQLVRVLTLQVNHSGTYGLIWDGLTSSGLTAPSGTYIYTVTFGNTVLGGQMSMIK